METPWKKYKEKNGVTPFDLLRPSAPHASEELAEERMSICQECPELLPTKNCKQCGCFMTIKTKYEAAKCPLVKW
jgi:hypothetical protein